jgi:glutaredoxin
MIECTCKNALERLQWLVSNKSPVVFDADQHRQISRRITELEGEKELNEIGQ